MIRSIDTVYNGYKFRSRFEARWAIYFDLINLEYLYEPDGINIGGEFYLPDFYIPKHRTYVEIKSIGALFYDYDDKILQDGRENANKYNKAAQYIVENGYEFVLFSGTPIDIINNKAGAFWFTQNSYELIKVIDDSDKEPEAEGASFTRFEHRESPLNMAKQHAQTKRKRRTLSSITNPFWRCNHIAEAIIGMLCIIDAKQIQHKINLSSLMEFCYIFTCEEIENHNNIIKDASNYVLLHAENPRHFLELVYGTDIIEACIMERRDMSVNDIDSLNCYIEEWKKELDNLRKHYEMSLETILRNRRAQ